MNKYKLYPLPQEMEYSGSSFAVPKSVRIVSNFDLSTGIQSRLIEALALENIAMNSQADFSINLELRPDLETAEKQFDYYELDVSAEGISLRGKKESGIYYGVNTLYQVLDQVKQAEPAESQTEIQAFNLVDYADLAIRGIIEGYYGIPWGNKKRADIFEFNSYFKMNAYAFAPKNDPYHRERWFDLYPETELEEIGKLARFAEEHYIHYIWTISPFAPLGYKITTDNQEEGYAKIETKFEQLYKVGVRQFGVLGDDAGDLPYKTVVYIMNKLNKWRKEKGDVEELIYCPQGYTTQEWAFKDGEELRIIDLEFDADIHIIYTGKTVCWPITDDAIDDFKHKATAAGQVRRDPLFWMNWPVNDIDTSTFRRLFMGPGIVYQAGANRLTGVLTNPMEQPEASNVANFATNDFAWNVDEFNPEQSWIDSFQWIEPNAPAALHEICKHSTSQLYTGAMRDCAKESVEIEELAQKLEEVYPDANYETVIQELKDEYQKIIDAVETFRNLSENEDLLIEMDGWLLALTDKGLAGVNYCDAILTKERKYHDAANRYRKYSFEHYVPAITNYKLWAQIGTQVINPNLKRLKEIADEVRGVVVENSAVFD